MAKQHETMMKHIDVPHGDIRICGFCGHEALLWETDQTFPKLTHGFSVICKHCHACGPWSTNAQAAIHRWNSAYERDKRAELEKDLLDTRRQLAALCAAAAVHPETDYVIIDKQLLYETDHGRRAWELFLH